MDDLLKFTWLDLVKEWRVHALTFLQAVAAPPRPKNLKKRQKPASCYSAMCMGGAVPLKERNKDMSALHHPVGLYLFHGYPHKAVSNLLHYLYKFDLHFALLIQEHK